MKGTQLLISDLLDGTGATPDGKLVVDGFAGGGGASTGMEMALGRPVSIAINHDESAILMHQMNHPQTKHYKDNIWMIDPREATKGRPVGLAWFSPDCKHFSRAKGAALVDRNIRGLAWVVVKWAALARPTVIMMENVPEFVTWGPVRKGKPVKKKAGQTFAKWKSQLEDLGYHLEYRELCAADYGAPTIRTRFCLIARCDGRPIVWPKPTHGPRDSAAVKSGKLLPWRSAAEVIDWTLPTYSIFESKQALKEKYGINAIRPLADNTQARIATGLDKFVIRNEEPFIVPVGYGERAGQAPRTHDIKDPLPTVVGNSKHYVCNATVEPYIMCNNAQNQPHKLTEPVPTITTGNRNFLCVPRVSPYVLDCNHAGGGHISDPKKPLGTVTAKCTAGVAETKISPFIAQQKFSNAAQDVKNPLTTVTSVGAHELITPFLEQYHSATVKGEARGQTLDKPILTVDASNRYGFVAPYLTQYFGTGTPKRVIDPMNTITVKDRENLAAAHISKFYGGVVGSNAKCPLSTVTAVDHNALTVSHLAHFKGKDKGQAPFDPLMTITAAEGQFGLIRTVIVKYEGQPDLGYWPQIRAMLNKYTEWSIKDDEVLLLWIGGAWWFISDIGLRMLTPRELYNAMGFPADYIIDVDNMGRAISRKDQVARCGNAVPPPLAAAMVRANLPEWCMAA